MSMWLAPGAPGEEARCALRDYSQDFQAGFLMFSLYGVGSKVGDWILNIPCTILILRTMDVVCPGVFAVIRMPPSPSQFE